MPFDKPNPTRRPPVKVKPVHFSVLGALGLAACGGGGGETTPPGGEGGSSSGISLSGDVVKGPVSNALVFVDYNNDGQLSVGEPSQRTDANGNFEFTDLEAEGPIVAITDVYSVDTSTGLVISGMLLTAPEGSTVISPLTTLMQQANLTSAEVASALNLESGIDLTSYNPFAAGVNADTALAVEAAAQQVSAVIRGISSAMTEAGVSSADAAELASNAVAAALADANSVDLTDSSFITAAITNATSGLSSSQASALSQVASAVATATANLNEVIAQSTSISSSDQFALIDDLLAQITAAVENDGDTSLIEFTDPQAVEDAVSGSGGSGEEEQQNSDPLGSVSISGDAIQGQTLTAVTDILADADGLGDLSYQWKADGVAITDATSQTFTLTADQVGANITVEVSYTDGGGTDEQVVSTATSDVSALDENSAPTGSVTISGDAVQGQTLTAVTDTLADADGLGDLSYQWKADGVAITGATAQTFILTQDQVGKAISVDVRYIDGVGTAENKISVATSDVVNVNDTPTGEVTITGTVRQGETLTADISSVADPDGLGAFTYQWKADGVIINGAVNESFTPTQEQVGKVISVEVTYTDKGGELEYVASSATSEIANSNDNPIGGVVILGSKSVGSTLEADTTSLTDADGIGALNFQWFREGTEIIGVTGSTFTLTDVDIGSQISVAVTYTDGGGEEELITSNPTAPITAGLDGEENIAPTILSASSDSVTKGYSYSYQLVVDDPNSSDTIRAEIVSQLPSWLTFDAETFTLSGTPSGDHLGNSIISFEVADGMDTVVHQLSLNVANTIKNVVIFIDDFSDRIFELGVENITLYDYGSTDVMRWYDYAANGYNGYDTYEYTFFDYNSDFVPITPDNEPSPYGDFVTETSRFYDYDLISTGTGYDPTYGEYVYDDYIVTTRSETNSFTSVNHGDWTIEAFLQQVDDISNTEIIAIDLDTLNGLDNHYSKLFSNTEIYWEGEVIVVSSLEKMLFNWLSVFDYGFSGDATNSDYFISAFSASIAGGMTSIEASTLQLLEYLGVPIFQSAPNLGNGQYDWGSNYSDVINVGAWNVDVNGNNLMSSLETFFTVDILANGLVTSGDWGSEFGTSFATPRVTGEWVNAVNDIIIDLEANGVSLSETQTGGSDQWSYSDSINAIIDLLSSPVGFELHTDFEVYDYVKDVLKDDVSQSADPSVVPIDMDSLAWGIIVDPEVLSIDTGIV